MEVKKIFFFFERLAVLQRNLWSRKGLFSSTGRILLAGKIRRILLCLVPAVARKVKKKHQLEGGCVSCGVSCNLLFPCPQWDAKTRLCTIYDDRPLVCRLFPITPADLRDRDLASPHSSCGYFLPTKLSQKPNAA